MLNWYRVERVLGRGGFGVIYLATDTNLDHPVAIKEYIPPGSMRCGDTAVQPLTEQHGGVYREGLERFIKEARNLVRFKHPNIVRVMSVFQKNNTAYMVMEFEEGENLNRYLARAGTRSELRLKSLIKPICEGLAEVHRHGFIHRDIKPANILVRADGSPVLLDFGSARDASISNGDALTALVTVGYAPLEQYNHNTDEQQGPWTDIYALAGVLYYAVTGGDPVDSARRGSALLNGGRDPLIPAATIAAERYSDDFLAAIDWALSFRIADRPPTLSDWLPALLGRTSIRSARREANDIEAFMAVSGEKTLPASRGTPDWGAAPALDTSSVDEVRAPTPAVIGRRSRYRRRGLRSVRGVLLAAVTTGLAVLWVVQKGPFAPEPFVEPFVEQAADATGDPGPDPATAGLAPGQVAAGELAVVPESPAAVGGDDVEADALAAERSRQIERLAEIERREAALAERQYAVDAAAAEAARQAERAAQQRAASEQARAAEVRREQEAVQRRERLLAEARERRAKADEALYRRSLSAAEEAIAERDIGAARAALVEARRSGLSGTRLDILDARLARVIAEIRRPITDAEFDRVVRRFDGLKRAIESKDIAVIDALTDESEQNALFRQLMLNFETLRMEITGIRVRNADKSVTANLRIERMERSNGDFAVPSEAFRDREMTSRLVDGEWSPIVW